MLRRIPAANAIICSKVSFDGKFIRCASIPLKKERENKKLCEQHWRKSHLIGYFQRRRRPTIKRKDTSKYWLTGKRPFTFFSWLKLFVGSSLTIFFLSNVHSRGYTEGFGPNIKVKSIEPCLGLLDVERDHVRSDIGRFILRNVNLVTTVH